MALILEKGRGKGQWWPTKDGSATIFCPECGKHFSIVNHSIAVDGSVSPSVVGPQGKVECPENCTFHDYIILKDWNT